MQTFAMVVIWGGGGGGGGDPGRVGVSANKTLQTEIEMTG